MARHDRMLGAMRAALTGMADWSRPCGGFYVWLKLNEDRDAREIAELAFREKHVVVLPGGCCYADRPDKSTIRLSFSSVEEDRIDGGIRDLAECVDRVRPRSPRLRAL